MRLANSHAGFTAVAFLAFSLIGCGGSPAASEAASVASARQEDAKVEVLASPVGFWDFENTTPGVKEDILVINDDGTFFSYTVTDSSVVGYRGTWEIDGEGGFSGKLASSDVSLAVEGDTLKLTVKGAGGSQTLNLTRANQKEVPSDIAWLDEEVTFENAIVLDNEYVTIELLRFYVNADYGAVDKCFEIKVTNNTENHCNFNLDGYIDDEHVRITQSGNVPSPGKSAMMEYRVYVDGSDFVPIDSLDQIYQFNGEVTWEVLGDLVDGSRRRLDYQQFPISFEGVRGSES